MFTFMNWGLFHMKAETVLKVTLLTIHIALTIRNFVMPPHKPHGIEIERTVHDHDKYDFFRCFSTEWPERSACDS